MEGVLAAFGRRPVAALGLVAAVVWIAVAAVESFTTFPGAVGGWYGDTAQTIEFAWRGVAGLAALVWLLERAAA